MNEGQQFPNQLHDLLQDVDLTTPLHELVQDPALLEEPLMFEPQELERLDALAQEYLQELAEQGMIPDIPPMDIDPTLLEPPQEIDRTSDFGR
jgi:hypothetical protein